MEALLMILLIQVIRVAPLHSPKNSVLHAGGIQSWLREADNSNAATESNQAGYDAKTGRKYGCYLSHCWRSCKKGEQFVNGKDLCENDEWCYGDLGRCSQSWGCRDAPGLQCYGYGYEPGHFKIGKSPDTPCPAAFDKYYCDTVTERSFGCSDSEHLCWRSCHEKEKNCRGRGKESWCYVTRASGCSKDNRCIVATQLPCGQIMLGLEVISGEINPLL